MKIIAVDDSPTILMTISAMLEELGVDTSDIYTFTAGKPALDFIEKEGADIIFCDVQMPEMDGYGFAQALIENHPEYVSRLFIVSADESKESVLQMKAAGAKRFIRKPINVQHFNHFVMLEIDKLKKKVGNTSEIADSLNEIIDLDALAGKIGISAKHMPKLLNGFLIESAHNADLLETAAKERNFQEMARLAHSIKGSAGNLKFDALYEKAKLIEQSAASSEEGFSYLDEAKNVKIYLNKIKQMLS